MWHVRFSLVLPALSPAGVPQNAAPLAAPRGDFDSGPAFHGRSGHAKAHPTLHAAEFRMPTPVSFKPVNSLWQEFKTFAFKGNMIDLAVGVVIGAAFGRVVSSLVDNIFMPLLAAAGAGGKGYE